MEAFTLGKLGELFTALAFAGALVSMASFFFADREVGQEKRSWERMGMAGFIAHGASILGIILTLFYMIYAHRYEYHYVWSHSSNELPVYYMISCFWEGQEGSFLLWCFWHSVLGMILLFNAGEWRNSVIAIISSVELILSSMLLGVYVDSTWVIGLMFLMAVLSAGYMGWRYFQVREALPVSGNFHLASVILAACFVVLLFRGQLGWESTSGNGFGMDVIGFKLFSLLSVLYLVMFIVYLIRSSSAKQFTIPEILAGLTLVGLTLASASINVEAWKLGSTPFTLLKNVFAENPIYLDRPDFVPSNGNGLNPLLQNYWMVIHPPTLFLGFASTVVPFAYVVAGLFRGKYKEWIRPAMPWMSFSVMILGIGIIMGGYWAYETLNFGGYWNWDPVENSSLVPWLCGVASLHAMLIYQKSKSYLKLTMIMIVGTFLLVLYSTFLTRSGILGETSVHTFTDLGLSGQLLVLLLFYTASVFASMIVRWREIPQRPDESKVWSAEFMLFMGIMVFIFSGLLITMATSIPVFNAIFDTNIAPPVQVQYFYYQWSVWFAILFGLLSGVGQFLWWKIKGKKSLGDALFRPFLLSILTGSAVVIGIMLADMDFAYNNIYADYIDPQQTGSGILGKIIGYLKYGIMSIADELLLYSSLFAVFANTDILISLVRKNRKGLKVMGGTVVHIGFGFMLLGMLFSSGYDEVISTNLRPEDFSGSSMSNQEKRDNVLLVRGQMTPIKHYFVNYLGMVKAQAPIARLKVIEENSVQFKLRFDDASGERFAVILPRSPYIKEGSVDHTGHDHSGAPDPFAEPEGEIDLKKLQELMNRDLASFEPELINNRDLYGMTFYDLRDTSKHFTLFPETEINEQMQSILPHPSRKIFWDRDIYVYTSNLPDPKSQEPQFYSFGLKVGDTARIGSIILQLSEVQNLTNRPDLKDFQVAAAANVVAITETGRYEANPIFLIDGNKPGMISSQIDALGMDIAFVGVTPDKDLIHLQVRHLDPQSDYVIIKAISKPFINLLWLGTFILTIGFLISIFRRIQEGKKRKKN
ncbi:MAG: cytochrome c biogenesis protein CcsA [Bacteroidota bacterium]